MKKITTIVLASIALLISVTNSYADIYISRYSVPLDGSESEYVGKITSVASGYSTSTNESGKVEKHQEITVLTENKAGNNLGFTFREGDVTTGFDIAPKKRTLN